MTLPIVHVNHSHHDRISMPQITDNEGFLRYLTKEGIHHRVVHRSAEHLRPTQNEINLDKVFAILESGFDPENYPLFVAHDVHEYVLDGHHRWYCAKIERVPLKLYLLEAKIPRLLRAAEQFHAQHEPI